MLSDGQPVLIRPLLYGDRFELAAGFTELSPRSRQHRFFNAPDELDDDELEYLTNLDYRDHFACAAVLEDRPVPKGVGVARYVREEDDPTTAEVAVTVLDAYQRRGIGTLLTRTLGEVAAENGIRTFVNYVQWENAAAIELLTDEESRITPAEPGVARLEVDLPARVAEVPDPYLHRLIRLPTPPGCGSWATCSRPSRPLPRGGRVDEAVTGRRPRLARRIRSRHVRAQPGADRPVSSVRLGRPHGPASPVAPGVAGPSAAQLDVVVVVNPLDGGHHSLLILGTRAVGGPRAARSCGVTASCRAVTPRSRRVAPTVDPTTGGGEWRSRIPLSPPWRLALHSRNEACQTRARSGGRTDAPGSEPATSRVPDVEQSQRRWRPTGSPALLKLTMRVRFPSPARLVPV